MDKDFIKIIRAFLLQGINEEELKTEVAALREEFPAHSSYDLSDILIKRTAILSSVSGGITGAVPWPFTMLLAVPDLLVILVLQSKMVLKLAVLADKEPSDDMRITELVGCMGASAGAIAGTLGVRKLIDTGLTKFVLPMILKRMVQSYLKSSFSKIIPFIGSVAGGSFNFATTMALGNIARDYYFPIKSDILLLPEGCDGYEYEDYDSYDDLYDDEDGFDDEDYGDEDGFEDDDAPDEEKNEKPEPVGKSEESDKSGSIDLEKEIKNHKKNKK